MRFTSALLLVLVATVVAPFAIATTWLTARIDDRQAYVDTVAPLADDPDVRRVLANASAVAAVGALQEHVPVGLPAAVGDWARTAARQVVESPEFPTFWRQANEDLHRDALAILEDPATSPPGYLTVDAGPLVAQVLLVLEERGIPVGMLPEIPLMVPVVERAKVAEAGPAYRAADRVARWIPVAWAGLVVLAVLVAAGWRGRVRIAGLAVLGVAVAAGVVLAAAEPVADLVADRADVAQQDLVRIMLDAVLASLSPNARGFLVALPLGLVLLLASLWPRRDRARWEHEEAYEHAG